MKKELTSLVSKVTENQLVDDSTFIKDRRKALADAGFKIYASVGMDTLAGLFRVLTEAKVFKQTNNEALFRFAALYFSTSHSETFKSSSFRSRFYNNQMKTLLELRGITHRMLEIVNEELRKCKS